MTQVLEAYCTWHPLRLALHACPWMFLAGSTSLPIVYYRYVTVNNLYEDDALLSAGGCLAWRAFTESLWKYSSLFKSMFRLFKFCVYSACCLLKFRIESTCCLFNICSQVLNLSVNFSNNHLHRLSSLQWKIKFLYHSSLCCVRLGQDTLLTHCPSPPKSIFEPPYGYLQTLISSHIFNKSLIFLNKIVVFVSEIFGNIWRIWYFLSDHDNL